MTESATSKIYSSTFPVDLPPDLTSPDAIAGHDQAAFHSLTEMLCHWDRPHRTSYHWLLPIGQNAAAVALTKRCQAYLPQEGLDHIPEEWLHLTIRRLGYADELSEVSLAESVASVASAVKQCDPFDMTLIPLAGSPGAVRFSVAPWKPLAQLFQAVTGGPGFGQIEPLSIYRPHVGVAYSSARQPSGPVAAAVRVAAESEPRIEIPIDRISLVRLWRRNACYMWDQLADVDLG